MGIVRQDFPCTRCGGVRDHEKDVWCYRCDWKAGFSTELKIGGTDPDGDEKASGETLLDSLPLSRLPSEFESRLSSQPELAFSLSPELL